MKPGPLTALRIVEYSTSIAAAASGKMLADLGAEVIKVEPPRTGDPARYHGPFPTISPIPNAAAYSCISMPTSAALRSILRCQQGESCCIACWQRRMSSAQLVAGPG